MIVSSVGRSFERQNTVYALGWAFLRRGFTFYVPFWRQSENEKDRVFGAFHKTEMTRTKTLAKRTILSSWYQVHVKSYIHKRSR
jgi:hypothetical protein